MLSSLWPPALALADCAKPVPQYEAPPKFQPSIAMLQACADVAPKDGAKWAGTVQTATVITPPRLPRKLDTDRVPVQYDGTNIAYLTDAHWVEKPDRLMQRLLTETLSAGGSRLILDPFMAGGRQAETLDGELIDFGVNADKGEVVIVYDAVWTRDGKVQKRRFEAHEPVGGEVLPATVAPAMKPSEA